MNQRTLFAATLLFASFAANAQPACHGFLCSDIQSDSSGQKLWRGSDYSREIDLAALPNFPDFVSALNRIRSTGSSSND